ncbi:MAG: HTH domain-containing protein [Desulfobacterales bacterium]|nr:HTH domain-containing protein [Desulfobacterales bacterium]
MTRLKNTGTKLTRLGQILRVFMEKEKVSSSWLSKEFHTTPRTIQRDLQLLKDMKQWIKRHQPEPADHRHSLFKPGAAVNMDNLFE